MPYFISTLKMQKHKTLIIPINCPLYSQKRAFHSEPAKPLLGVCFVSIGKNRPDHCS